MRIVIDTLGEQAVVRELIGIGDRAVDLAPAMDPVMATMRRALTRQFDSQGVHGSGGWAPLAPATVARKRARGLDPRILHATRRLRDSLTERGHRDEVAVARHDGADFGTTVPYARHHQFGTSRMPRRRPVQLPEVDRRQIVRIIQRFVVTGELVEVA